MTTSTNKGALIKLVALPIVIVLVQILCFLRAVLVSFVKFLMPWSDPRVVRTPEDRFKGLDTVGYTFKPNYVELPIGGGKTLPRLHYVDEGRRDAQETLLCLHGEPSWSFLYRQMIPIFVQAGYRVVAPDFIGFGKSDKYAHPESYTHDLHTMTLRLLLDHLKIQNLTLVCQDWGGLTGLTVVKDSPHFFSRLIIMNTGLPVGMNLTSDSILSTVQKGTPFLLWRSIAKLFGIYLPIQKVFEMALKHPTQEVLNGYCAPFPSPIYKGGVAQWPLLVPITSTTPVATEMQEARDFLTHQWKQPALILFASDDAITKGELKSFQMMLPKAPVKIIDGAGHFLQDDKGDVIANEIINFISKEN